MSGTENVPSLVRTPLTPSRAHTAGKENSPTRINHSGDATNPRSPLTPSRQRIVDMPMASTSATRSSQSIWDTLFDPPAYRTTIMHLPPANVKTTEPDPLR